MSEIPRNIDSSVAEFQEAKSETIEHIIERVREIEPEIIEQRTQIHENPELGGEEEQTAARVKTYLEELGIEIIGENIGGSGQGVRAGKEGHGIVAIVRGQEGGPTVALRADMDALPITEPEENEPCSKNEGVMHACGHDVHTSSLMGAANVLKTLADKGELEGDVVLLFQPSEEKAHQKESGAVKMVKFLEESGLRDKIGAFYGLHVLNEPRGTINVKEGVFTASSGEIDIKLTAPGGHVMGAYESPNLHRLFSRVTVELSDVFEPLAKQNEALVASTRTNYEGSGYNVLPAEAESTWTVRVSSEMYKQISRDIITRIKEVVNRVIAEDGSDEVGVEVVRRPGYRPIIHRDSKLVAEVESSAEAVLNGRVGKFQNDQKQFLGGEDFSFYLEEFRGKQIPGVFVMVGAAAGRESVTPFHSPKFSVDENAVGDLAAIHASFAVNGIKTLKRTN